MATHRAWVQHELGGKLNLEHVSTPTPSTGQVLVKVLATPLLSYTNAVLSGSLFPLVHPLTPGIAAIARISATGPDTTSLKPGQLVFCSPVIRARDDPTGGHAILHGWFGGLTPEARKLMEGPWRNGAWAEKMLVPCENVVVLDEALLTGAEGMGYKIEQLMRINEFVVPFGGWLAAEIKAGDVVIVAPSTGHFGGAAVQVSLALGVKKVVAAGRNSDLLKKVSALDKRGRVLSVQLTGDTTTDTTALQKAAGSTGADAYLDFSPPQAAGSTHPSACISALKHGGRAILMGGITSEIKLNYAQLMLRNIAVRGNFMYPPAAPRMLVNLVESGLLDLHSGNLQSFAFEDLHDGIAAAEKSAGAGELTVLSLAQTVS